MAARKKPAPEAKTPKRRGMTAKEQRDYLRRKAGWPPEKET